MKCTKIDWKYCGPFLSLPSLMQRSLSQSVPKVKWNSQDHQTLHRISFKEHSRNFRDRKKLLLMWVAWWDIFKVWNLSRFEIESVMSRSQTGWQWLSFPGTYFYFTHPNLSSHLYNMLKGGQKLRVTLPKGFNTKCGAFLKCLIQWGGRIQYSECSPEAMNGCKCNV